MTFGEIWGTLNFPLGLLIAEYLGRGSVCNAFDCMEIYTRKRNCLDVV